MSNSKVPAKLFVGQVPISMDEPQLKAVFEPYGSLVEVAILRDRGTARHKGCAFVIYAQTPVAPILLNLFYFHVFFLNQRSKKYR